MLVACPIASAQQPRAQEGQDLGAYMRALAARRLIAPETGSVERLRELVRQAEELYLDERYDQAALLLFEVAESPRFADFVDLEDFRGAEYMLAGALQQLDALRTSFRYLERILRRGPRDPYFGPAYRRAADVALESGDIADAVQKLEAIGTELPEDASNELRYLQARAAFDAGDVGRADGLLSRITPHSRFRASALYLRGVLAARAGHLREAENHFCTITGVGDRARETFYVDWRYFEVKDLARLALGRIAHEGRRGDDAFYYYFQVPSDSERLPDALFEAAYSTYEAGDNDTAIDLLDQLGARFPDSPFVDEAGILRGYVHLGRCEFDRADRLFRQFIARFGPLVAEIDRVLASPSRRATLYDELLETERRAERERAASSGGEARNESDELAQAAARARARAPHEVLLALLRVDPAFYSLHADVRSLDAERARSGRVAVDLEALLARVRGRGSPRAAAPVDEEPDDAEALRRDLEAARAALSSLNAQLDTMRRARAPAQEVAAIERELRTVGGRLDDLERRTAGAMEAAPRESTSPAGGNDLEAMLARDIVAARSLPARAGAVRGRMASAANDEALRGLRALRERLAGELRRARIGRIDAVMGSKRRIEIQIESLAAGRFPPELQDPLRIQGLLRDDEEYWPFEGEYWPDEYAQGDLLDEDNE